MKFSLQTIILLSFLSASYCTNAALPVAVDGQALPTLAPMLERVQQSIVSITSDIQQQPNNTRFHDDPFFKRFFDQRKSSRKRNRLSTSIGVIVDANNGYILTNEHSIAGATNIVVTLVDGREISAKLVGVDKVSDVAVIQVEETGLTEIEVGNSDALRVGDFVVSVGDPLASQSTITSGLVSALSKKNALRKHQHFIQSDVGFGPGVLVNLRGEMIGLNISRVVQTKGRTRTGFSTPVNLAMKIKQQIAEFGDPQRGFLAIQIQDMTTELANILDVEQPIGAIVTNVSDGSSAEKSGLKVGDVVMMVEGQAIFGSNDLRSLIGYHFVGEELQMEVLRNGSQTTLLTLLESPTKHSRVGTMIHQKLDGATFKEVGTNQGGSSNSIGILATNVKKNSEAWNNGVRVNDRIVSANRKNVSSLDEFRSAINNKEVLMLNILRGDGALFLLLQ